MEYVMVPVPEALVAEVEKFRDMIGRSAAGQTLEPDVAANLLNELDEPARKLLLQVAKAADVFESVTMHDAAEAAGCSEHELLGRVVELNNLIASRGGPHLTVIPFMAVQEKGGVAVWPLRMTPAVAHGFLAATGGHHGALE
jgi:hypothetical protein